MAKRKNRGQRLTKTRAEAVQAAETDDMGDVGEPTWNRTAATDFHRRERNLLNKALREYGYEVKGLVGQGNMGTVYRAWDLNLNRRVALKILQPHHSSARFRKEAKALATLESPHVVSVYAFLASIPPNHGLPVIVMEYVVGRDLLARMKDFGGSIPETQARDWMRQTALGMAHVAEAGICHRDLKPSNILIRDDNCVKVADFGVASIEATLCGLSLTHSSAFLGTLAYMAPEQADDPSRVTFRADIYSFGATFYHALTGQLPFAYPTFVRMITKILHEMPPSPRERNPSLSAEIDRLLMRCLAKSPEDRFQSFHELLDHLGSGAEPSVPRAFPLWVYKCNSKSSVGGHWEAFFSRSEPGPWGGTHCINSAPSRKIIREDLRVGDYILAWQTDEKVAWGLCRVVELRREGTDIRIVLQAVQRFPSPIPLLAWKKKSRALAAGIAFQPAKVGTLFATTPEEAQEILRICRVPGHAP